jgi:hypothetical protein
MAASRATFFVNAETISGRQHPLASPKLRGSDVIGCASRHLGLDLAVASRGAQPGVNPLLTIPTGKGTEMETGRFPWARKA